MSTAYDYQSPAERVIAEIPCQNCGKPVLVMLPFLGCVFCEGCSVGQTTFGSEQFIPHWKKENEK